MSSWTRSFLCRTATGSGYWPTRTTGNLSYSLYFKVNKFSPVWSISMSRTFPRSCYSVSYAIKNQLVASKAPY